MQGMYGLQGYGGPGDAAAAAEPKELKVYTREEVAQHCKLDDAWAIVDGYVYDITPCMQQIKRHTESVVSRDLGKDISMIFKQIHSQRAKAMLVQRRIGVLAGLRGSSGGAPLPRPSRPAAPQDFKQPVPPPTKVVVTPPKN